METKEQERARIEANFEKTFRVLRESSDASEMARFITQSTPLEFATILAHYSTDSAPHHLALLAWQQQLCDRQIAASHKTARQSAIWGGVLGFIGALIIGLLVWVLSGEQPPPLHQRSPIPAQAQAPAVTRSGGQNQTASKPAISSTPSLTAPVSQSKQNP